ncbi:unnamed protein product [Phaeothamnion confervicola]
MFFAGRRVGLRQRGAYLRQRRLRRLQKRVIAAWAADAWDTRLARGALRALSRLAARCRAKATRIRALSVAWGDKARIGASVGGAALLWPLALGRVLGRGPESVEAFFRVWKAAAATARRERLAQTDAADFHLRKALSAAVTAWLAAAAVGPERRAAAQEKSAAADSFRRTALVRRALRSWRNAAVAATKAAMEAEVARLTAPVRAAAATAAAAAAHARALWQTPSDAVAVNRGGSGGGGGGGGITAEMGVSVPASAAAARAPTETATAVASSPTSAAAYAALGVHAQKRRRRLEWSRELSARAPFLSRCLVEWHVAAAQRRLLRSYSAS